MGDAAPMKKTTAPKEPFVPAQARKLLSKLLNSASTNVTLSPHCKERMVEHKLDSQDVEHVLRTGSITEPAELERETWRYRVHKGKMWVVVAFAPDEVIGVTAWTKR